MANNRKALSDEQRNAFTVAYRLYEKYHGMDGTPDDWESINNEARDAWEASGRSSLTFHLLTAILDTIGEAQTTAERAAGEQIRMVI